jgi:hypothetical protein
MGRGCPRKFFCPLIRDAQRLFTLHFVAFKSDSRLPAASRQLQPCPLSEIHLTGFRLKKLRADARPAITEDRFRLMRGGRQPGLFHQAVLRTKTAKVVTTDNSNYTEHALLFDSIWGLVGRARPMGILGPRVKRWWGFAG